MTRDRVLAIDDYGNKVYLMANRKLPVPDLMTDGRVLLTPHFARRLAQKLIAFADKYEGKRADASRSGAARES